MRDKSIIFPELLQRADMTVVSYEKCFRTGGADTFERYLSPGENFCAGYKNGTTTCGGDSGGGLAIEVNGRWFLRGIVSFGAAYADRSCDHNYVIFLDVAMYVQWIMDNIKKSTIAS
jgi:secreted trypsin-like serine protease